MEKFGRIIIGFFLVLLLGLQGFSILWMTRLNNRIYELVKKNSVEVENQTALFYRVIGENIPVVIPDNSKE